jgi:hypothetical protein
MKQKLVMREGIRRANQGDYNPTYVVSYREERVEVVICSACLRFEARESRRVGVKNILNDRTCEVDSSSKFLADQEFRESRPNECMDSMNN